MMVRAIFLLLTAFVLPSNAAITISDLKLNQYATLNHQIAMDIELFDGDIITVLLPKSIWVRVLSHASNTSATDRSAYNTLTETIYNDGVYSLKKLSSENELSDQSKAELKVRLNHFLTAKVSFDMLGYVNFKEFKHQNFRCDEPSSTGNFVCELKPNVFLSSHQAAYIMATNGFLVDAVAFDFSNARFIGKTTPW